MKRRTTVALLLSFLLPVPLAAAAAGRASPDEAQALVKKAIEFYRKRGREAAFNEFSREDGAFVDRELYVTVYALDGTCHAHINQRLRGLNTMELRDPDGKYYTRERVEAAQGDASGWQDYKSFNRVTRKIEQKRLYWERHDGLVFGAGSYRGLMASM